MIAAACFLLANLSYPQPILGEVARALRLPEAASGAIITAGQLGSIAGLLLVAPLGDIRENRSLCAAMSAGAGLCALAASQAGSAPLFLALMGLMGVFTTATQVLVVFATALAGPARSGRTLGIMACGLFRGIALSRPVASLVAGAARELRARFRRPGRGAPAGHSPLLRPQNPLTPRAARPPEELRGPCVGGSRTSLRSPSLRRQRG